MTRYSRSVIPGRPPNFDSRGSEPLAKEIDSLVFGKKGRAANDEDDDDLEDDEAEHLVRRANTDRRSRSERRTPAKGRRQSDFAPLPGEGPRFHHDGSKRGPILLAGAAVIVAVFFAVVWNAYREGVRPQDSNTAPQLAEAGAFKSKPETVAETTSSAAEASVFEQVEAPKPNIEPAPEVREEPAPPPAATVTPPPAPAPVVSKPVEPPPQAAAVKSAPVKPAAVQPAATQQAATQPPAPKPQATQPAPAPKVAPPPAAVSTPVQTAAAPKEEAISLIGGPQFRPAFAPGGKYVVQIAAAATESGAAAEWNKRVKAMPELFPASAEKIIVQADVDGRTVYRVRVGAFASAPDADAYCNQVKAKGGACFRTAR